MLLDLPRWILFPILMAAVVCLAFKKAPWI
jgi:hypothetical protein